jgi:KUP system potassium uptake protein
MEPHDQVKGKPRGRLWFLSLAALGVVFGDIGTSPLYAVRESFSGHFGVEPTTGNVFGVLSLITWTLLVVVTMKYVLLVLRVDNQGEGGILALAALLKERERSSARPRGAAPAQTALLLVTGLFGAALLYGDGLLTPAISVLSAVEGLEIAAPTIGDYVVPIAVAVIVALFMLQRQGTTHIGKLFGPITLVWFLILGALGVRGILLHPEILRALNPIWGFYFLADNWPFGVLVLGAVFLVATGAEALYADLGHFGRRPIQLCWFGLALPALLLNYFGQGALVLTNADAAVNPFFILAPDWSRLGLVAMATMATVIASQAVITGVFSLTMQAVQLGFMPRLEIRHTSATEYGQIYMPQINWLLALGTVLLVVWFGSSASLAGAYGLAIVGTMVVTTILLFAVAPARWGWPRSIATLALVGFLLVELVFLVPNLAKIREGGWVPLAIGIGVFTLMTNWHRVRELVGQILHERLLALHKFLEGFGAAPTLLRSPGTAVYMTGNPRLTPPALLMNVEHQKVLHERIILVSVRTERVPIVPPDRRVIIEELPHGFHRVTVSYGFMQTPDMGEIVTRLGEKGLKVDIQETTFFLGRERVVPSKSSGIPRWRTWLFSFLSRNSQRATAFFNLPPDRVVEVGSQIEV